MHQNESSTHIRPLQNNTEMSQLVAGPKQTTHAAHTDSTDVLSTSVWTLKAKS